MANEKEPRLELERVELRGKGMNVPGAAAGQYPSCENVIVSSVSANRLRATQHYNLWLTPDRLFLVVEHPTSGIREMVPICNVAQFRVKGTNIERSDK